MSVHLLILLALLALLMAAALIVVSGVRLMRINGLSIGFVSKTFSVDSWGNPPFSKPFSKGVFIGILVSSYSLSGTVR